MNTYMRMQILNMVTMTQTFDQACELAAQKDDGHIDAAETKTLQQIKKPLLNFAKNSKDYSNP